MKDTIKFFGLLITVLTLIASCSEDSVNDELNGNFYCIRSVSVDGKAREKFLYNNAGKIIEYQSSSFCQKFIYDNNNRVVKQEIAVDPNLASSSYHPEKSELMTSYNSTFTGNYIYEYNHEGKLTTQKNYFKKSGQFEYTSMISLVYEGDRIVTYNLHNAKDSITQFHTYEYDSHGNVTREKYFSYLFNAGSEPKLISEVSYKYDDKNNPFIIYKDLGQPGLYTNTNNIIETNSVLYEVVPGIPQLSTSKTTYEYNDKGFPVKLNNSTQYKYE
jgi:hypothetical protein